MHGESSVSLVHRSYHAPVDQQLGDRSVDRELIDHLKSGVILLTVMDRVQPGVVKWERVIASRGTASRAWKMKILNRDRQGQS